MRLGRQLLLLTLGPLAAASAAVGLILWPAADRLLVASAEREAREALATQAAVLDSGVSALGARLEAFALMPQVRDEPPAEVSALLRSLRPEVPDIDALNFIARDGTVHAAGNRTLSVRERYYYPSIERGEPVVSKAIRDIDLGGAEVLVTRPVRNRDGSVKGAVGASLRLHDLLGRLGRVPLSHPGFTLLVDADGRTLSSAPVGAAGTSALFTSDTAPDRAPPAWRAMIASMASGDDGATVVELDRTRYRVYFRRLRVLGWRFAIGFDEAALLAPRATIASRAAIVLLVLAVLAVAAALGVQRRVVAPLADLAGAHEAVTRGDLAARATVPEPEELARLATSFNRMADDLRDEEARRQAAEAERVRALRALEEREAMLNAVFEASPAGLALFREEDARYLRVNAAYARLLKTTPDALAGDLFGRRGLVPDAAERDAMQARFTRDGSVQGERLLYRDPDGQARDLLVSIIPVAVREERIVILSAVDVSETVRLEAQLRQSQKLDLVGRLVGGIAHDFNNMLAGITGAADLLALELEGDGAAHEDLAIIRESARRAAALTQQLLTFSRVQPMTMVVLDAHEPVRAALALARRTFVQRITIREELDVHPAFVRGNAALLQTVVMNLLVNARDAMPGGGTLTLRTASGERVRMPGPAGGASGPTAFRLDVVDSGEGMAPELIERIFEPFFTTKASGHGTGLGLSVALGVLREHGGQLAVESTPGAGSTFTVWLPIERHAERAAEPATGARLVTGRLHVLLADDEPLVRSTLTRTLEAAGHAVHAVADGEAAVAAVQAGARVDVAVLDLMMPRLDGAATLQALRARRPGLPVIVVSGYDADGSLRRLATEPGVFLLPKPFGSASLTALVARAATRAG